MRKNYKITLLIAAVLVCAVGVVLAGNPHFIQVKVTQYDSTLNVSGKEAGLGNETQVHIVVEATAACINRGSHHPRAANKTSVSAEGDFPVQNGKAYFDLTLEATFQPECSPPMTVEFSNIEIYDAEHDVYYQK
jgi:hypothetical protein